MFFLLLQLWLAATTLAAPIADPEISTMSSAANFGTGGGVIGFLVLVLDVLVWSTPCPSIPSSLRLLTSTSRALQVQPPAHSQDPLGTPRLHLPGHRRHRILLPLRPQEVERERIRASWLDAVLQAAAGLLLSTTAFE